MIDMERLESDCFQIISNSGNARSLYIEAIQYAKEKKYNEANKNIEQADKDFIEAHKIHAHLIQNNSEINILLIHALDIMMSAESFGILSKEFVQLYTQIID